MIDVKKEQAATVEEFMDVTTSGNETAAPTSGEALATAPVLASAPVTGKSNDTNI